MRKNVWKLLLKLNCVIGVIICFASSALAVDVPAGFVVNNVSSDTPFQMVTGLRACDDKLYVADAGWPIHSSGRKLIKIDLESRESNVLISGAPLGMPGRMICGDGRSLTDYDLILADINSDGARPCCNGRVFKIDPATGSSNVLSVGSPGVSVGDPGALALSPGGLWPEGLFVLDIQGASKYSPFVYLIDNDGARPHFFADPQIMTTETLPRDIAFGSGEYGNSLYISNAWQTSLGVVYTLTPDKQLDVFVDNSVLKSVVAIEFGPGGVFGNELYVYDVGSTNSPYGAIYKVSPTGELTLFADGIETGTGGLKDSFDITFSIDGKSLFVGTGANVLEITSAAPIYIETDIDFDPDTLNLNSKGKWVTCYIEVPYNDLSSINIATIRLQSGPYGEVSPFSYGDFDNDGNIDVMIKFDRQAVIEYILDNGGKDRSSFEIIVEGDVDQSTKFKGSDFINLVDKKK